MKNRIKKYTASALLALAAAAMLTACGGGASSSAPNIQAAANTDTIQNVVTGSTVTLDGSTLASAAGTQTYKWSLETKPAGSNANLNDPAVPTPRFIADKSGTYIAKLVTGNGASTRVTIMAGVGNVAPVANAGATQNVTTGTIITLDGSASSDVNSDPLSYRWWFISKPADSTSTLTAALTAAPAFSADMAGTYIAQLIVNDGTVDSAYAIVSITATTGNAVPVANAGAEQNVIAGALVTLDGSASSDVNSDPMTYHWGWTYRPTGSTATLTGADSAAPTFKADKEGTYIARLVVNDGTVNSAAAAVIINVATGNAAPVADAGAAQNVLTGTLVTLNGSASSDANADPLTYQWMWVYKPTGSRTTLKSATTVAPTFSADLAGSYIARLIVNDGKVNSAAALVRITTTAGNAVPVANAGTTQSVIEGSLVTLDGSASSDANSDPITYKWTLISKPAGSTAALAAKTTAAPTFGADLVGTYVARLVVNDGTVNSEASTVIITATTLPAGYVTQGGLVWSPDNLSQGATYAATYPTYHFFTWPEAEAYCANFSVNGVTGWRLPTQPELSALYASGAMIGQGWMVFDTWSSTQFGVGLHYLVRLYDGYFGGGLDTSVYYVSCVHYVTGIGTPAAPSANAVSISGTAQVGQTLTGNYTYADANNDLEGATTFRWLRNGSTEIVGATANTYTLAAADVGNTITFEVTPVALTGTPTTGTSVASSATASVAAAFVTQGGLYWMPITASTYTWANAETFCATYTNNGVTGWRMPTDAELRALYVSGAMNGQGWMLGYTWTSTANGAAASGLVIDLSNGYELWYLLFNAVKVTCVIPDPIATIGQAQG